jgi:hypothetical protein
MFQAPFMGSSTDNETEDDMARAATANILLTFNTVDTCPYLEPNNGEVETNNEELEPNNEEIELSSMEDSPPLMKTLSLFPMK